MNVSLRIVLLLLLVPAFVILTQDAQIFPGAVWTKMGSSRMKFVAPKVEATTVRTSDQETIEVWRLEGKSEGVLQGYAAILFRGNGGPLDGFMSVQQWLADLGATSYSFNYRGFGNSTGWPTEEGIDRDADAVWSYVAEREALPAKKIVIVGISLGTGPAAHLASKHEPKLVVLYSPFVDLPTAASEQPLLGWLYRALDRFIWNRFATRDFVSGLQESCLFVVHGELDSLVVPENGRRVFEAYHGRGTTFSLFVPDAGHNDIFFKSRAAVTEAIPRCIAKG